MREPEAPLAPGVACERTYQVLIDGKPKPLLCRWFVPEAHPEGDWMCHAEIIWPDGRVQKRRAGGVDSLQALQLALTIVSAELLMSEKAVYFAERDDDLGLPVLDSFADELAERKARYEGK